jgi:membrane protein
MPDADTAPADRVNTSATSPATSAQSATLRANAIAFYDADPMTLAASIAFYSALSFAPVIVLSLSAAAEFWPGSEMRLVRQLGALLGPQVRDVAELVVTSGTGPRFAFSLSGLVSLIALLVSASTALAQLQDAINRIWSVVPRKTSAVWTWVRRRLLSFGMIAVIGFFLVITLVVSTLLSAALVREGWAWAVLNEAIALLVFAAAFAALFRFVPDRRAPWSALLQGAFITAVLFDAGKWSLGAYLANSGSADAYGTAGSVVLLLVWVYYSSLIVLIGAAATRWLALRRGALAAG